MLAVASCWLAAVLTAVPLASSKPTDQSWTVHYSSQVARPLLTSASPASDENPIPRFHIPFQPLAARRQDFGNNLQGEAPVQVMPGDKVSLVVNGRSPLDPKKFVDVTSLLMELQKSPPASDGAYHVFLAPPNYPLATGGQKFDVTYVGAPQRDHTKDVRNNPHPPLFVAPLDYSVPHGYGRIQVPTRNVKFQSPQFQQAQFRPAPAPVQLAPQQAVQLQPQSIQVSQPAQFQSPQPVQFQPPQPVQFQPPQPVQFQPRPVQPAFQPVQIQQPVPVPMAFRPVQTQPIQVPQPQVVPVTQQAPVFVDEPLVQPAPPQVLEEIPSPNLALKPQEPLVLAAEKPQFLDAPVELPLTTTETPLEPTEIEIAPAPLEDPVPEITQAPFIPPPPTPQPTEAPAPSTTESARPAKKRPIPQVQKVDGSPQWPDFQTVRQRQQQNRQQINRQRPAAGSGAVPPSPALFTREPSVDPSDFSDFTFGQKLRPKIKTNALVSPPVAPPVAVVDTDSFDADPPVIDRDEPFQTLESQNAASNRGRIRFNRPLLDANALPTTTEPTPVRQTESVRSPGKNRFRITTTTAAPTTTEAQSEEPTTAEPVVLRGDSQPAESEEEEATETPVEEVEQDEEEGKIEPTEEEKPWNPRLSLAAQQRQSQSAETTTAGTTTAAPVSAEKPSRGRGSITFANSRLNNQRLEVVNRPVVLRPAAPRVRLPSPGSRIQRPVIQQLPVVREQEDFVAPISPEFGIRDGVAINPAPSQSLLPTGLPVGRRVPESRPAAQTIRIGRPTLPPRIQPTTEKIVEVEPEEEIELEEEEIVEEPFEEEESEQQEEIIDEEIEENSEDVVSNLAESSQVSSALEADETVPENVDAAAAESEAGIEQENAAEEEEQDSERQTDEEEERENTTGSTAAPVTEAPSTIAPTTTLAPISTTAPTTEAVATEEPEVLSTETSLAKPIEETPIELSVANSVDELAAVPQVETADDRQVLGVSTATEVSLMYELCYRGRCVRVHE